jgi:hypothetical protein
LDKKSHKKLDRISKIDKKSDRIAGFVEKVPRSDSDDPIQLCRLLITVEQRYLLIDITVVVYFGIWNILVSEFFLIHFFLIFCKKVWWFYISTFVKERRTESKKRSNLNNSIWSDLLNFEWINRIRSDPLYSDPMKKF